MMNELYSRLTNILRYNLEKILEFKPYDKFEGIGSSREFIKLISKDPAFKPFYLNREKYVTARIGGNLITSIHRKLGDLYEEMILELLSSKYNFPREYLKYSLEIVIDGRKQRRTTDGRLILDDITDLALKRNVSKLTKKGFKGLALEVRSCYQIGDSKRIQADEHMARALKNIRIEPKMLIFCNTSLTSPVRRLSKHWSMYQGKRSFDFVDKLTGFNFYNFLLDQNTLIKPIMDKIFNML